MTYLWLLVLVIPGAILACLRTVHRTPLDPVLSRIRWPKRTPPRPNLIDRAHARLWPAKGCHTVPAPTELCWGAKTKDGLIHRADTGSFKIPDGYGKDLRSAKRLVRQ